ncbi:MAG: sulfotransferase [Clostridiales bacterium]|nr:sulfotransferase [Clostridiales bacterium]
MNYYKKMQLHYLHGGNLIVLFKLLFDNKFKINIKKIPVVLMLLISNLVNVPFILLQKIIFGRKIKNTEIKKDPVFILGHWRSGTTYLANLMTRDEQFGFFNILQTYHPSTYILLKPFLHFFGRKVIPKQRPQDNIKVSIDLPQEEDYAVSNRSIFSMIHFIAFPRNMKKYYQRYGCFSGIGDKELNKWKRIYINELKKATYSAGGKQLVIKTPINTARIKVLLDMFPNAKFVHIHRNPYRVCLSTQKVYRDFFPIYDLQYIAGDEELERTQLEVYETLYKKYLKEKGLIPDGNFTEVSYDELTQNPMDTINNIYKNLGITGFDEASENFKSFIDDEKTYKTHSYSYDEAHCKNIKDRLGFAFDEFGYPKSIPGKLD